MSEPVYIPLINPNEPDALLASLPVSEGQQVRIGEVLCTLETTKSTAELAAEVEGFIVGLLYQQGQSVRAGDILCYLADSPDWQPPQSSVIEVPEEYGVTIPDGLRITKPALTLARRAGLDISSFPSGSLVTESAVREMIDRDRTPAAKPLEGEFDPESIIVYGGGGHGKSVIELLRAMDVYQIRGILDDGIAAGEQVMGFPVLGGRESLAELSSNKIRQAVNAVGGIGNVHVRVEVFDHLANAGFLCPEVVHPTAFVEPSASLSQGIQIFPLAYVGSEVSVGYGAIVNTSAVVSHECVLGEYSNISPGALLAGGVQVGPRSLIGMGATVNLLVKIGAGARIGNGATVKTDVPENGIVRAGTVWPE